MVDTTTLIVISTIVQTVVITITLVIFVLQFRSQERAIHEASYQGLMGRYNDFIRSLVENPDLAKFLMEDPEETDTNAITYAHLLVAYGIIEEAYLLYRKNWIDEDTWQQWSAWLKALCARPELKSIHERTAGTFDGQFEDYVTNMLKNMEKEQKLPIKPQKQADPNLPLK